MKIFFINHEDMDARECNLFIARTIYIQIITIKKTKSLKNAWASIRYRFSG